MCWHIYWFSTAAKLEFYRLIELRSWDSGVCSLTTNVFRSSSNFRNGYCKPLMKPYCCFIFNLSMEIISLHSDTVPLEALVLFKCLSCSLQSWQLANTQFQSVGRCVHTGCLHLIIMHVWILSMSRLRASKCNSNSLERHFLSWRALELFQGLWQATQAFCFLVMDPKAWCGWLPVLVDSAVVYY